MKRYSFFKLSSQKRLFVLIVNIFILAAVLSAHQPRIVNSEETLVVAQPEVSKAYYGKLQGTAATFRIVSGEPFHLYVNVLVPDIAGQKKDVSVAIVKSGDTKHSLAVMEGSNFKWKKFFEPFGHDTYWMGPEYAADVASGTYDIVVSSSENTDKYVLAVGEKEVFGFQETVNALRFIPKIKRDFFEESPANFIFSPLGSGYVIALFMLAFIVGMIYRTIIRRAARNRTRSLGKNIDARGRWFRALLGTGLLVLAVTTTWNPLLIFFAGFTVFEALFSWCGFYAALGKSTCPL
jgi:hypothetical protein